MGNFGFGEMAIIAIFGLLVFGPQRLPEIARNVGGFIREFKTAAGGVTDEFKMQLESPPKAANSPAPASRPADSPTPDSQAQADPSAVSTEAG